MHRQTAKVFVLLLGVAAAARSQAARAPLEATSQPAAGANAMAPQLATGRQGVWLSWIEPGTDGEHRLRVAAWSAKANSGSWSAPTTVVASRDMLANWADVPAVMEAPDGSLVAHWLRKLGQPGAYSVELARSADGGATWTPLGPLPTDAGNSEHGFVSYAALGGELHAFWMDGRNPGSMTLFGTALDGKARVETVLDARVCDCCATAAAATAEGAVVVYRDRDANEVRDIGVVRFAAGRWQPPASVHADGWKIRGCPVNGPAVAAMGHAVAVAWFTAAGDKPRVLLARSVDGGATFAAPVVVDDQAPLGHTGVALDAAGNAWVSWMGRRPAGARSAEGAEAAELRLRRVDSLGAAAAPLAVAELPASRTSGGARIVYSQGRLLLAWIDPGGGADRGRLRVGTVAAP